MKKRMIDGLWIVGAIVLASIVYTAIQKKQAKIVANKPTPVSGPKVDPKVA